MKKQPTALNYLIVMIFQILTLVLLTLPTSAEIQLATSTIKTPTPAVPNPLQMDSDFAARIKERARQYKERLDLTEKAETQFNERRFGEAIQSYTRLMDIERELAFNPESDYVIEIINNYKYKRAECYYFSRQFDNAIKDSKSLLTLDDFRDKARFLIGKCYWELNKYDEALEPLNKVLESDRYLVSKGDVRLLMSMVHEDRSVQAWLKKDYETSRHELEASIEILKPYVSEDSNDGKANRYRLLKKRLEIHPNIGFPLPHPMKDYSKDEIFEELKKVLSEEQATKVPYPFEVNQDMRDWVKQHIPSDLPDLLKARRILKLMLSLAGLALEYCDEAFLNNENEEVSFYRTSAQVFCEWLPGSSELGDDPDKKYRYGNCATMAYLYVALAREAGLKAYMVRPFVDVGNREIAEHRCAAVLLPDHRMIFADLTWADMTGVQFPHYTVLNDSQYLSHYLYSANSNNDVVSYYRAGLSLYPENEIILCEMARRSINEKDFEQAASYLDQIPQNARHYYQYWQRLAELHIAKGDKNKAYAALEKSNDYVTASENLLKKKANLLFEDGRYEEAYECANKAIYYGSRNLGAAYEIKAKILVMKGNFSSARYAYASIGDAKNFISHGTGLANFYQGEMYRKEEKYPTALEHYAKAYEHYGSGSWMEDYIYKLSFLPNDYNERTELKKQFESTLLQFPKAYMLKIGYINSLLIGGYTSQATNEIIQVMKHDDFNRESMDKIVYSLVHSHRLDSCLDSILDAMKKQAISHDRWLFLGDELAEHNKKRLALKVYRRSLNLPIPDHTRREIEQKIETRLRQLGRTNQAKKLFLSIVDKTILARDAQSALDLIDFLQYSYSRYDLTWDQIQPACELIQSSTLIHHSPGKTLVSIYKQFNQTNRIEQIIQKLQTNPYESSSTIPLILQAFKVLDRENEGIQAAHNLIKEATDRIALLGKDSFSCLLKSHQNEKTFENGLQWIFDIIHDVTERNALMASSVETLLTGYDAIGKIEIGLKRMDDFIAQADNPTDIIQACYNYCNNNKHYNDAIRYLNRLYQDKTDRDSRINYYINLGVIYSNMEDHENEIEAYHKALIIDPTNIATLQNLVIQYRREREYRKAEELLERLLDHSTNNRSLSIALDLYKEWDRLREGLRKLEIKIRTNGMPTGKWAKLANAAITKKLYHEAIYFYKQEIENISPVKDIADYYHKIAECYQHLQKPIEMVQACEQAIHFNAHHADAHGMLGRYFLDANQIDKAENHYKKMIPSSNVWSNQKKAMYQAFHENNHLERLKQFMQTMIDEDEQLKENWLTLGDCAKQENHLEDACWYYKNYMALTPAKKINSYRYCELIDCLFKINSLNKAGKILTKALSHHPDNKDLLREKVNYHLKRQEWQAAEAICSATPPFDYATQFSELLGYFGDAGRLKQGCRVLAAHIPEDASPSYHYSIASTHFDYSKYQQAIKYFKKMLTIYQEESEKYFSYYFLALSYQNLKKYQQAEIYFKKAYQLEKDGEVSYTYAFDSRVNMYEEWMNTDALKACADEYFIKHPEDPKAFCFYAKYHRIRGDVKTARQMYLAALNQNKNVQMAYDICTVLPNVDSYRKILVDLKRHHPDLTYTHYIQCVCDFEEGHYEAALASTNKIKPGEQFYQISCIQLSSLKLLGREDEIPAYMKRNTPLFRKKGYLKKTKAYSKLMTDQYEEAGRLYQQLKTDDDTLPPKVYLLLQTKRFDEAEAILKTLTPQKLKVYPWFYYCWLEYAMNTGNTPLMERYIKECNKYHLDDYCNLIYRLCLAHKQQNRDGAHNIYLKLKDQFPLDSKFMKYAFLFTDKSIQEIQNTIAWIKKTSQP